MIEPIDYATCLNLVAMFYNRTDRLADQPFLWAKHEGHYTPLSGAETAEQVSALAQGLVELGLQPGDRVLLVSENRPEWLIADMAIMAAGAITVPAYTTGTASDFLYTMTHSGARAVIVSTLALAQRVLSADVCATLPLVIVMHDSPQNLNIPFVRWAEVLARGARASHKKSAFAGTLGRDDTACIIYTSGTGGTPKGVMLSHGNILHNCLGAYDIVAELGLGPGLDPGFDGEVFLSFLPLSHAYEHTIGQFFPISIGAQIYYAEGIDRLAANMLQARPTIMIAVPRLYESMRDRILRAVTHQGGLRERLFRRALALGRKRYEAPDSLTFIERTTDALLDLLVRRKVFERFGGRLKAMVSGGAPLNYDVGLFFIALGVRILQGYGQTECAPLISCNRPHNIRLHTVGPPVTGVDIKIADDGEILVRGPLVMPGYWQDENASRAAIDPEGWLHTGDIGIIDNYGAIQITDRKKDIIVNSGGDNVSPQRVEGLLTLEPEIGQAMVIGDRKPHLVALIVPDMQFASAWAVLHGHPNDLHALVTLPEFHKAVGEAVERFNRNASAPEKVRRFILADEPFSEDNKQLTPSLKIRRHQIKAVYGAALDKLYG